MGAGATPERPRPFLTLAWCCVAAIAVVERRVTADGAVTLALCSLPRNLDAEEAEGLGPFLDGLARRRPQLVGYHSYASDLPILRQRALALGLAAPDRAPVLTTTPDGRRLVLARTSQSESALILAEPFE